ncbi:hypothetical protein [Pseudomonas serbica]|uniref:hypothetical protein n=1 Tax=Pseudomonas serbica TaxID=2965074 RepID=UPI00237ACA65|nr:hypothetical protein [Pseudomonas serbica]
MFLLYSTALLLVVTALCVPHLVRPLFAAVYSQALDKAYLLKAYWPKDPEPDNYHLKRLKQHRNRLSIRADAQICSMGINADLYRPNEICGLQEALYKLQHCDGVVLFENGRMIFPDGQTLDIHSLTKKIHHQLVNAYVGLDEAASIITDYADDLGNEALAASTNKTLYSISGQTAKYPLDGVIGPLALLLGVDPDKNDLAAHGGDALWSRNKARLFGTKK